MISVSLHPFCHGLVTLLQRELRGDSAFIQPVGFGPEYSSKPAFMIPSKCAGGTYKPHGRYSSRNPPSLGIFHFRISLDA